MKRFTATENGKKMIFLAERRELGNYEVTATIFTGECESNEGVDLERFFSNPITLGQNIVFIHDSAKRLCKKVTNIYDVNRNKEPIESKHIKRKQADRTRVKNLVTGNETEILALYGTISKGKFTVRDNRGNTVFQCDCINRGRYYYDNLPIDMDIVNQMIECPEILMNKVSVVKVHKMHKSRRYSIRIVELRAKHNEGTITLNLEMKKV